MNPKDQCFHNSPPMGPILSQLHPVHTFLHPTFLRYTAISIGVLGFDSRRRLGIFLFTTASRSALGPTQPPIQWVPGTLSLGVKRPGREAHHSPPSSAEVNNAWCYNPLPQYIMAWCLVKHRDNFTFTLPLHCNIIFPLCPGLPSGLFPSGLLTESSHAYSMYLMSTS
jgi:hypothetical protein